MNILRRFIQGQGGFTLPELLVAVGILGIVTGTIGTAIFQSLGTEYEVIADGLGINELRKGFSWFAEDVKMAQSSDLTDGGSAASTVSLSWTDQFADAGTNHTSSYALVGDELVRTYDGNAHTVARKAVSVSFSLSGKTITAQVEVQAEPGQTRTLSVSATMRSV